MQTVLFSNHWVKAEYDTVCVCVCPCMRAYARTHIIDTSESYFLLVKAVVSKVGILEATFIRVYKKTWNFGGSSHEQMRRYCCMVSAGCRNKGVHCTH